MTYLPFIFALPFLLGVPYAVGVPERVESTIPRVLTASVEEQQAPQARSVPFYSQFSDITSVEWQKVGCGIASLAMVIDYHKPNAVPSVDILLKEGIEKNAYSDAGWTYKGLIEVAQTYGISGESYDLGGLESSVALARLSDAVRKGPVIASVHYTLDPKNPIPHLIVVYSIEDDIVRYNDPADPSGNGSISIEAFAKAWKQRYIELYPDVRFAAN